MILERLIPIAKSFKVVLLGSGLPAFFLADLGDMTFTLGLSGWTNNDWSKAGNFDLMAPRGQVDLLTKQKVFNGLKETWFASAAEIAQKTGLNSATVSSALTAYTQAGRVIYDLKQGVYRVRELSQEPLDFTALRFGSEQEKKANELITQNQVKIATKIENEVLEIKGKVREKNETFSTLAWIDKDQRLTDGSCECSFYQSNKLRKGPCEHILATRMMLQNHSIKVASN